MFIHIRDHCGSIRRSIRADTIKEVYTDTKHDYSKDKEYYTRVTLLYTDDDSDTYRETINLEDLMSQIEKLGV